MTPYALSGGKLGIYKHIYISDYTILVVAYNADCM